MKQIEIFSAFGVDCDKKLTDDVNKWIITNNINVIDVKYQFYHNHMMSALVIYEVERDQLNERLVELL